jgi:hypothetical protein
LSVNVHSRRNGAATESKVEVTVSPSLSDAAFVLKAFSKKRSENQREKAKWKK